MRSYKSFEIDRVGFTKDDEIYRNKQSPSGVPGKCIDELCTCGRHKCPTPIITRDEFNNRRRPIQMTSRFPATYFNPYKLNSDGKFDLSGLKVDSYRDGTFGETNIVPLYMKGVPDFEDERAKKFNHDYISSKMPNLHKNREWGSELYINHNGLVNRFYKTAAKYDDDDYEEIYSRMTRKNPTIYHYPIYEFVKCPAGKFMRFPPLKPGRNHIFYDSITKQLY